KRECAAQAGCRLPTSDHQRATYTDVCRAFVAQLATTQPDLENVGRDGHRYATRPFAFPTAASDDVHVSDDRQERGGTWPYRALIGRARRVVADGGRGLGTSGGRVFDAVGTVSLPRVRHGAPSPRHRRRRSGPR